MVGMYVDTHSDRDGLLGLVCKEVSSSMNSEWYLSNGNSHTAWVIMNDIIQLADFELSV